MANQMPSKEVRARRVARGVSAEKTKRFEGTRTEAVAMENLRKRGLRAVSTRYVPGKPQSRIKSK